MKQLQLESFYQNVSKYVEMEEWQNVYNILSDRIDAFLMKEEQLLDELKKIESKDNEIFLQLGLYKFKSNKQFKVLSLKKYFLQPSIYLRTKVQISKVKLKLSNILIWYINSLIELKKYNEAKIIISKNATNPSDEILTLEAKLGYLLNEKEWSMNCYQKLIANNVKLIEEDYVNYLDIAIDDNIDTAYKMANQAYEYYPSNEKIALYFVKTSFLKMNWKETINRFEEVKKKINLYNEVLLIGSVTNQILGDSKQAESIMKDFLTANEGESIYKYDKPYLKVNLLDNGESRIEYYKMTKQTKEICLTFDSINITWDRNPFSFNFIQKFDLDIIALRRRTKDNYYQDLQIEKYHLAVRDILKGYDKTFAYGFSLGAYAALYYASELNASILSLSPRLSVHPNYNGKPRKKTVFTHQSFLPRNESIKPIIIYDPKDQLDNKYIETNVKKSFPNGQFIKTPYSGHSTAPYLLSIGLLKKTVQSVFDGEPIPIIDRKKNLHSYIYINELASHCLRRNKLNWAKKLIEYSLSLEPDKADTKKISKKILQKMAK
ncbi:hypothetical protein [Cytobacillus sp. FSL R7-0680]|uniref:hypothetical protein n=1 Tax=Cytobacillus sp. FSL R7-0680 TaxID=2921689 RepID=UPI0030F88717